MKKTKKLFASDYDHTLCQSENGVTEECIAEIKKFRQDGNIFGIITGRCYEGTLSILKEMGPFADFIACMTGALAMDGAGNIIFEYKCDGKYLCEILKFLYRENCMYLIFNDGRHTYEFDLSKPLDLDSAVFSEEICRQSFTQINTKYETVEKSLEVVSRLREKYGELLNPHINGSCIDIPPRGVSKNVSVARLAKHFGVSFENVFTAGDNNNDVSMLKEFHGYTVPHGVPLAKQAAEKVLPGVAEMLRDAADM